MPTVSTGTTTINYGSALRIGYRPQGSLVPFTYVLPYPTADQLPNYEYEVPITGNVELEYTEICPNCSGNTYSDPVTLFVNLAGPTTTTTSTTTSTSTSTSTTSTTSTTSSTTTSTTTL